MGVQIMQAIKGLVKIVKIEYCSLHKQSQMLSSESSVRMMFGL